MKCTIHQEKCIACGLCQLKAPEIFDYNDEGIVFFKGEDFSLREKQFSKNQEVPLTNAIKKCPTQALRP